MAILSKSAANLTRSVLLQGSTRPFPSPIPLRAGPLTLQYEDGGLRYIRLGDREVVRRIYASVRDSNWGTVPQRLHELHTEILEDSFRITFQVDNVQDGIDFSWKGSIEGDCFGQIKFILDGVARSSFLKNRIGFCVLHPMCECSGTLCHIQHADGSDSNDKFPYYISPENPFQEIRSITHQVTSEIWAEVKFEGDIFETEDQRNWSDASFKTFCTPLRIPFPVEVRAGERIFQQVTLTMKGIETRAAPVADTDSRVLRTTVSDPSSNMNRTLLVKLEENPVAILPEIGLQVTRKGGPVSQREKDRLRRLSPSHLRVELRLWKEDYDEVFSRAEDEARSLQVPLEVAIFVSNSAEQELLLLLDRLRRTEPRIARWLIFHRDEWSTRRCWVKLARGVLELFDPHIPVGTGTNANFTELNRQRPPIDVADFVSYSLHPQEHAFDNASLVETLKAQAATVDSARQFIGELPIVISPVTLRKRVNPYATGSQPELPPGKLLPEADVRQMSLFGAAWTIGSVKYLAESNVASVTYFETIGLLGVMESEAGSPYPEEFRSLPGSVFPIFHVLADLNEFAGAEVLPVCSSASLLVDGLALRKNGRICILLANMSHEPQSIRLTASSPKMLLRALDETNAINAMTSPEDFRNQAGECVLAEEGWFQFSLRPFAVARGEFSA